MNFRDNEVIQFRSILLIFFFWLNCVANSYMVRLSWSKCSYLNTKLNLWEKSWWKRWRLSPHKNLLYIPMYTHTHERNIYRWKSLIGIRRDNFSDWGRSRRLFRKVTFHFWIPKTGCLDIFQVGAPIRIYILDSFLLFVSRYGGLQHTQSKSHSNSEYRNLKF